MRKAIIGLGLVGVLTILFLTLNLGHHWLGIFLLLAIIFYALFGNPMKHVHADMEKSKLIRKKESRSQSRGKPSRK